MHNIPNYCTVEDIAEDIKAALGIVPEKITLVQYKEKRRDNVQMTVVEGSKELMEATAKNKTIFIEYKRCRIDTTPILMTCKTCTLIGHTAKHCSGIPAPILVEHKQSNACLDCLVHNSKMASGGFNANRFRYMDHAKNSSECPTRKALLKKMKNI